MAQFREQERQRPDRLFDDPWAAVFTRSAGLSPPHDHCPLSARIALYVAVRTRFFDDFLGDACAAGPGQVVLLAAGLDSRAFRLRWTDEVRLYELDLPQLLAFKEDVLASQKAEPKCLRTVVPSDLLTGNWPAQLIQAGFNEGMPSVWLIEGLLMYLDAIQARHLLETVSTLSAPGSQLALDCGSAYPSSRGTLRRGGLGATTGEWLHSQGWNLTTHRAASLLTAYRRPGQLANSQFYLATRSASQDTGHDV
ncbi:SAM-dependent methyltransferase [Streptomyces aureoversilis]|uniref:S-adenosyl-L-methionine-dependent methyltransferase n=1 Tax=Streptomyces aureoversilis TaxID=67277 RepID=A0ABW0A853_9ACTN